MHRFALALLFCFVLAPMAHAQTRIAGDWQGTLDSNDQTYRIAWHVTAAADGTLTSTIDNLDEQIFGIKVKSTVVKERTLTLIVDDTVESNGEDITIRGTTAGTFNDDMTELTGTWTQTDPDQPPVHFMLKHVPAQPKAPPAS